MMILSSLTLLVYILAVYRLTKLFTWDAGLYNIFERWRMYLLRQSHKENRLTTTFDTIYQIFTCPYCMGVWMTLIILALPFPLVLLLGIAGGQFLIETCIERIENDSSE